ncbi:MAG: 3-deoxy-manno-octulosonate cytidylyltransferase [Flammeovirgaceae bacterium]|jgi:3-deoxy-manno-octulosonate cytidylyltransferase (CMP-KDO synthetase)|nr:3-deoxy-manno-octulosonate cytidylyltransferase [Flammeovirgaceae bacterium]|tara:strand:- start:728 stop:1438 length:711 start_codon:yes stop_codon:yes gene_type:complete
MKILGIIPSRMESKRLPGKPLKDINGKSMIQRVYESAIRCEKVNDLIIATPNDEIIDHVKGFNGDVIKTSDKPINGTERVYEAYKKIDREYDYIINIQGDEPFIKSEQIEDLIKICKEPNGICTLIKQEKFSDDLNKNSVMKVVKNINNEALYFSRSLIPYGNTSLYNRHICIYSYKPSILKKIVHLQPTPHEISESLEQLRWLENGFKIKLNSTDYDSFSIDTKSDLEKARNLNL